MPPTAQKELKQCGECAQKPALQAAVAEAEKDQKATATSVAKATLEANNQNALVARLETAVKSSGVALNAYASGTSTGAGEECMTTPKSEPQTEFARKFCADMAQSMLRAMFDGSVPDAPAAAEKHAAERDRPAKVFDAPR